MSQHSYGRYPNLVKHLEIVRPDQIWCADLTYIRLPKQFGYLVVLMDTFTRSIRGWELAGNMLEDLPKAALLHALEPHRPEIHHSDQGVQYTTTDYVTLLQAAQSQISMAAQGKLTENGYAERLMRTLKEEAASLHDYEDLNDALAHIAHFLDDVYMTKRVHSALDYLPHPILFSWGQRTRSLTVLPRGCLSSDRTIIASSCYRIDKRGSRSREGARMERGNEHGKRRKQFGQTHQRGSDQLCAAETGQS